MFAIIVSSSVAPLVGAWIEITSDPFPVRVLKVAPLVGAWIEIMCNFHFQATAEVAPLVGAWIEITDRLKSNARNVSLLL